MEDGNEVYQDKIPTEQILRTDSENSGRSDVILWNNYKDYQALKVSKITASNLFRYAQKYYYILDTNNASDLQLLSQEKRIHVMKALSSLSKFLGIHEN
jgi:hypothetical protein